MFYHLLSGLTKTSEDGLGKAHQIRRELSSKFGVRPYLSGSLALGINVPGNYDYDFGITAGSPKRFDEIAERVAKEFEASPYNKEDSDYRVFQGKIHGEPVDIALILGGKGKYRQEALQRAKHFLTDEERKRIIEKKQQLQNAWFFKDYRYKKFKRETDKRLGIPLFERHAIWRGQEKEAEAPPPGTLNRSDLFGHRTFNLDPIIRSGKILAAAEAKKLGLLKSYEINDPTSRERTEDVGPSTKLRTEIFVTKGLLPATATYGPYGVLFRSRKAEPSRYLNLIPGEHVIPRQVTSKLTYVVPDKEKSDWELKYPGKRIIGESEVPDAKRLAETSYTALFSRLLSKPKWKQEVE